MKLKAPFHNFHNESIKDLIKTGVYTIEFLNKPGLYYVGSATSFKNKQKTNNGFYRRWLTHYNDLINKRHSNIHLQRIVNKYGIKNLKFKILIITEPYLARYEEQYWINILNTTNKKFGYNVGHVCIKNIRFKMSKESNIHKSIIKSKPVLQYDLKGNFITEFKSLKEASLKTKINYSCILHAVNDTLTGGGFQWKYKTIDYLLKINPVRNKIYHTKKINQFSLEKKLIREFNSVNEVVKFLNCSRPNFIRVLKRKYGGTTGIYKNYYWEYK